MKKMRHRFLFLAAMVIFILFFSSSIWALGEGEFKHIATGGFGDSANSYSWGLTEFDGDVYVSTGRHHLWMVMMAMESLIGGDLDFGDSIEGPDEPWGHPDWANALRAEIWRFRDGEWEPVHRSGIYFIPEAEAIVNPLLPFPLWGYFPAAYSYRTLGTFDGHIYALGVGTWMPPMANTTILRSLNGDDWDDVTGNLRETTNIRAFVQWRNHVYVAVAPSAPGGGLVGAGGGVVYRDNNLDPDPGDDVIWEHVSEVGFGDPDNTEINYLQVFNDCLYASTVNFVTGFEVWKTCNDEAPVEWTPVIKDGFGDTWCQSGLTMEPFGDYLYVGTAVPIGMVMKDQEPVGSRAIDIIRIDKNDNAELIVGAYFPVDPPPGWPTVRVPLSFMPAGFGNPFNVYAWHMAVYKDWLVLGTLDLSGTLLRSIKDLIIQDPAAAMESLQNIIAFNPSSMPLQLEILNSLDLGNPEDAAAALQIVDHIIAKYGGADLWKTKDGINWEPVTLSGFKNPLNYGIRRTVSATDEYGKEHLYIGTANPFTGMENGGCEVLMTPPIKAKGPKDK